MPLSQTKNHLSSVAWDKQCRPFPDQNPNKAVHRGVPIGTFTELWDANAGAHTPTPVRCYVVGATHGKQEVLQEHSHGLPFIDKRSPLK